MDLKWFYTCLNCSHDITAIMKALRAINTGLQKAGLVGRMPRAIIPSKLGHFPSMQRYGGRASYVSQAPSRRAPSYRITQSICRIQSMRGHTSYNNDIQNRASYSTSATSQEPPPTIHDIFETATNTWQYIVADPSTKTAVIIDPVLDYDPSTQTITTTSADSLLSLIQKEGYKIDWILETHAHADHLTAASYLQSRLAQIQSFRPPIGIGKRIEQVQKLFGQRYGIAREEWSGVFDKLFEDDETFSIGGLTATAIHLPGHTPDHLGYQIGDNVFCGDSLFHADIGTARCDFPGGNASSLFTSGRKLLTLSDDVKIWPGHDYPPNGRNPVPWMSVREQKEQNKHLREAVTEEEFVSMRMERDETLPQPMLLHPSLQINIRAGRLPVAKEGRRMLHLPLRVGGLEW